MSARILIVAMPGSIHTARDVELISGQGWDVHVLGSADQEPHSDLRDATLHLEPGSKVGASASGLEVRRLPGEAPPGGLAPPDRAGVLASLIEDLRPDLIHSMELQRAGYMTLGAKAQVEGPFPPWIAHNWGMDISLMQRGAAHRAKIRELLTECDYYWSECERDVSYARSLGFGGIAGPVLPITGGFDIEACRELAAPGPTSSRSGIAVKGNSFSVYRPQTTFAALERDLSLLAGRELMLFTATPESERRARSICESAGAELTVVSGHDRPATHDEILAMHGRARVSSAMALGDGICTSLLDAIAMGAFPVFSDTGCGSEWAVGGRDAMFVDPEDVDGGADAIRRALTDDELVDAAAATNLRTAQARLDRGAVRGRWVGFYEEVMSRGGERPNGASLAGMADAETPAGGAGDARARLRADSGSKALDADKASRLRREALAEAFLGGGSADATTVEAEDLWTGSEDGGDAEAILKDVLWTLARQAEQMRAAQKVAAPEPVDPELLAEIDGMRWQAEVTRIRSEAEAARQRATGLEEAVADLRIEVGELRRRVAERERRVQDRESRLEERREEINHLRARLDEPRGLLGRALRKLRR